MTGIEPTMCGSASDKTRVWELDRWAKTRVSMVDGSKPEQKRYTFQLLLSHYDVIYNLHIYCELCSGRRQLSCLYLSIYFSTWMWEFDTAKAKQIGLLYNT